jgi:hypothetical protein
MRRVVCALMLVALTGCSVLDRTHEIADVTEGETIALGKMEGQGHVYMLTVIGEGHIDGTAEVSLSSRTETLSGEVRFEWYTDWYTDSATIHYTPLDVEGGHLTLRYRFES